MGADRDPRHRTKHRLADEDILHALRNAVSDYPNQGDHELTMAVGPARNGVTMLEVGYLMSEDGLLVVIHAMKAQRKYLEGGRSRCRVVTRRS